MTIEAEEPQTGPRKPKRGKSAEELRKVHARAVDRRRKAIEYSKDERSLVARDHRFCDIPGAQWDEIAEDDSIRLEINRIKKSRDILLGDYRQNKIAAKVRPRRGGATKKLAETHAGIIRNQMSAGGAEDALDNAAFELYTGGIAAIHLCTDYGPGDTWEQEVKIEAIHDANGRVWIDPNSTDENHRDARWMCLDERIHKDDFARNWPGKAAVSLNEPLIGNFLDHWTDADFVTISRYYEAEEYDTHLIKLSDGRIVEDDDDFRRIADELAATEDESGQPREPVVEVERRPKRMRRVWHYRMSGAEVLEGPDLWAGKFIPLAVGYGVHGRVGSRHWYHGIVRPAIDPQKFYNFAYSANAQRCAESLPDVFVATSTQIGPHKDAWQTMNVKRPPVLMYEPDPKADGKPQKQGGASIDPNLVAMLRESEEGIKATLGMFSPSLGDNPSSQSGKAIVAQQRQGDMGTYVLMDNFGKLVKYVAEQLLDLNPRIYDTERQERIVKEDGSVELVYINQEVIDEATGKKTIVNDFSVGEYDIIRDVGPGFSTRRQETLGLLTEYGRNNPQFQALTLDMVAKMIDMPEAEEVEKRFRKQLLSQGLIEPNEEEAKAMEGKQDPARIMQMEAQMLGLQKMAAEVDKLDLENEKTRAEVGKVVADAEKIIAEIQKLKAEGPLQSMQQIVSMEASIAKIRQATAAADATPEQGQGMGMPMQQAQPQMAGMEASL